MRNKLHFAAVATLAAAALVAACSTPPGQTPEKQAEQCKVWRTYLPARSYENVLEECSHQLGQAYCTKCLRE
jgi:hypothetical protein